MQLNKPVECEHLQRSPPRLILQACHCTMWRVQLWVTNCPLAIHCPASIHLTSAPKIPALVGGSACGQVH